MNIMYLTNGLVKLIPDPGKKLVYAKDGKEHSEAIVTEEEIEKFSEVEGE